MSSERGFSVDHAKFRQLLEREKNEGASSFHSKAGHFELRAAGIAKLKEKGISTTADNFKYEEGEINAKVVAIWQGTSEDGNWVDVAQGDCAVILDKTNFYAESGGQLFDTGIIEHVNEDFKFIVNNTQVAAGYVAHVGAVLSGSVKVGDDVTCSVNMERRRPIMANHTSTHMLNFAIREKINPRSDQRGSIVSDDKFRFDYGSPEAATRDQLEQVELLVNKLINDGIPVYIQEVPTSIAKEIDGVRAIFHEAYPDPVRVVSIGAEISKILSDKKNSEWKKYSIEFCGGTHLKNTSEAQCFSIVSEEALQQGVRRIEAVTGSQAKAATETAFRLENTLELLKTLPIEKLPQAFLAFKQDFDTARIPMYKRHDFRQQVNYFEQKIKTAAKEKHNEKLQSLTSVVESIQQKLKDEPSLEVVSLFMDVGDNFKILSDTAAEVVADAKKTFGRDVAVFLASKDSASKKPKTLFVSNVPAGLISRGLKANEWVASVAASLGGKGGGAPTGDVASGSVPDPNHAQSAVDKATEFAKTKLHRS